MNENRLPDYIDHIQQAAADASAFVTGLSYARVSTQDQNIELQREALSKAGCKKL